LTSTEFHLAVTNNAAHRFHAMSDTPDDIDRESASSAEPARGHATHASRTADAGREFLHAVGGDLAAAARRMRRAVALASLHARLRRATSRTGAASTRGIAPARRVLPPRSWIRASGRVLGRFALVIGLLGLTGALAVAAAMLWVLPDLPLERPMGDPDKPSFVLEAANSAPLGRVGPLKFTDAPLADFPDVLRKAVVSIEDHRFYSHFGVDPLGIIRAARRNADAGGIEEGGSTITQQLVKLRYVGRERTYQRKAREAVTAVWLEAHLGKDEILTRYLNSVYLGAGAFGMPAAARLYFDKAPRELTLPEAAMLAGLIKAPSQFNPLAHPDAAQARAVAVLDAMVDNGAIDRPSAEAAKATPATAKAPPELAQAHSWFTDWVGAQAAAASDGQAQSLHVRTTLMPEVQRMAQETLNNVLATQGRNLGVSQGALVAMRPDGAVLAMVGGRDYGASQFNRAVDALRQPGSSFKLFVYLTALRKGYSPQDTIDASAVDIKGWEPENYGGASYGRMTLADAFAHSVNTAAVRLAMQVGLNNVIATARDLGIDTPLQPMPSMALGAFGVNLLEMTGAFASVRANRLHITPWGIAATGAPNGGPMQPAQPPAPTKTLGAPQQPMIELMRGVVEHGTGRGASVNGFAAGKTGTSQDYHDAWFIGFTDNLVVGIWVGNDDNSPMKHVTGGSLPATIWKQFVTKATPLVGAPSLPVAAAPAEPPPASTTDDQAARSNQAAQAPNPPGAGLCDPQACAGKYSSFNPSDCTYQPYSGGPRRLCEMGPRRASAAQPGAPETTGAATAPRCNVEACARTYSSFDPTDCTYKPFGSGSRQLCEK
jgi:penicillin-binding protein 1A